MRRKGRGQGGRGNRGRGGRREGGREAKVSTVFGLEGEPVRTVGIYAEMVAVLFCNREEYFS